MARKLGLSADDVLAAAIQIADRDGLAAVTLASVAAALGVRSPSLYAHVDGLDALRRALAIRAATDMADAFMRATARRTGAEAIRAVAHEYRRFARKHPGLYAAVQRGVDARTDPELHDALLAVVTPVFQALAEAGVDDPAERVHVTRVFRSALHGFVALEQLGGFGLPQDVNESFERIVDLVVRGVAEATVE